MKRSIVLVGSMCLGAALAHPVISATRGVALDAPDVSRLALPSTRTFRKIDPSLTAATGEVEIVVQLDEAPVIVANGENAKRFGGRLNRSQQIAHTRAVANRQSAVLNRIRSLGGKEIGRVRVAYNAVIVRVDAAKLGAIEAMPEVVTIRSVGKYKLDLTHTVPYTGASMAHGSELDGSGVRIAILDSGIDYTHRNLGGPGTVEAYQAAAGTGPDDPRNTTLDGLFPTAKVVGGYDFVGEHWPNGPRTEDPDPIDRSGHGTHVADIAAGRSADGSHTGIAPGASLYAIKVCSSISDDCNGVALLLGMDYALDPNGDGSTDDAVDIINLSIGAGYGQKEDDLSAAAANAVRAGVVVVSSAGNHNDRPYITSSPGSTPQVISVANTQVPTALTIPIVVHSPAAIAGSYPDTELLPWAPVTTGVTGNIVYVGRGCRPDALEPDAPNDPYLANPAGKIALIDRGDCNISNKIRRATEAGAIGVIIGLVAPGAAVSFENGGQCPEIPDGTCVGSVVTTQATSELLKTHLGGGSVINASISESFGIPLAGSVVSSSSRGPSYSFNHIKPDIAAPGASVSAKVGTGSGVEPASGTSGAAPVIAGAAALLLQADPTRSPTEIKALLMNTADTEIYTSPALEPGVLAPITRIGAGEVRIDRAIASQTAAWDVMQRAGSLSFGFHVVHERTTLRRQVRVQNYADYPRIYKITPSFRYADDAASGAVKLDVPSFVFVPPRRSTTFDVHLTIDPRKLPIWTLNGGLFGGDGFRLQSVEFDGHITLSDAKDQIQLAWHVLPHRAAAVRALEKEIVLSSHAKGPGKDKGHGHHPDKGKPHFGKVHGHPGKGKSHFGKGHDHWGKWPWAKGHVHTGKGKPHPGKGHGHSDKGRPHGDPDPQITLQNFSRVLNGGVDVFSLTGTSRRIPRRALPGAGDEFAIIDLAAVGVRLVDIGGGEPGIQFAIHTHGRRSHPAYPGGFEVQIDLNFDGVVDYYVFNMEIGSPEFLTTGQTAVFIQPAGSPTSTAYFYADADLNSGNVIFTAPLWALGMTPDSRFRFSVLAVDNYFTGAVTDAIHNMVYTPAFPRFHVPNAPWEVPAGGRVKLKVERIEGGDAKSPSQTGFLLLYRDAAMEAETISVKVK